MADDLQHFTLFHVVLSVLGIVAGLVLVGGLVAGRRLDGWAAAFLSTTVLANLTGFGFPFTAILPSHLVAGLSLLVLPLVAFALYGKRASGPWRRVFTIGATAALYMNVFVLVVQLFRKIPAMQALAPTESELPFALTQGLVLALFVMLGRSAARGYGPSAI
jgi:hypothetical protein